MMKIVAAVCCLIAMCEAVSVSGNGPTMPVAEAAASCSAEGMFASDSGNMCWYHECILNAAGGLEWLPRRCAWMSRVSSNYVSGESNPCTVRIDEAERLSGNPCERKMAAVAGPPACHPVVCQNGGTPVYESNICWCECPPSWQGDFDCSLPTMIPTNLPPQSNICVDGAPMENWCDMAGGCMNGGTCYNQCDTFWCDCGELAALSTDHVGKRCETDSGKSVVSHDYPPYGRK